MTSQRVIVETRVKKALIWLKAVKIPAVPLPMRDVIALATENAESALSSNRLPLESAAPWIEIIATASLVLEATVWDVSQSGQLIQQLSHHIQTMEPNLRKIIAKQALSAFQILSPFRRRGVGMRRAISLRM